MALTPQIGAIMAKGGKFTTKQQRFVDEYLVDLNATQAAIRAGYSAKRANAIGYDLLTKTDIQAAIRSAQTEIKEKAQITTVEVLKNLSRISKAAEGAKQYGPAIRGQELIGKHIGMFVEKIEHTGRGGGPLKVDITVRFIEAGNQE